MILCVAMVMIMVFPASAFATSEPAAGGDGQSAVLQTSGGDEDPGQSTVATDDTPVVGSEAPAVNDEDPVVNDGDQVGGDGGGGDQILGDGDQVSGDGDQASGSDDPALNEEGQAPGEDASQFAGIAPTSLALDFSLQLQAPLAQDAALTQPIYLKGDGNHFDLGGWQNIFYPAGPGVDVGEHPTIWHLVYTGDNPSDIVSMQLDFGDNGIWKWTPDMGFSTNEGGNNPGWVIVAPADWTLFGVKNGVSQNFLVTKDMSNPQFNISGYTKGTPDIPVVPKGTINLQKYVDGIDIAAWLTDNYGLTKSLSDFIECFNLYSVTGDGASYDSTNLVDSQALDLAGTIKFSELADGWYAVEEVLTTEGQGVFEQAPVQYIEIVNGSTVSGGSDFDYSALYTIVNGYGAGYTLGYPGLNNTGDIFPIAVTNTTTGAVYPSFCANGGSVAFSYNGYYVARTDTPNGVPYNDILSAYNYIEDHVGDLNANRAITQIVTWSLLGAIDTNSTDFDNIDWTTVNSRHDFYQGSDAKADVLDVMANYHGYQGNGTIVGLAFMVDQYGGDFHDNQPQLVPLYGGGGFYNHTNPPVNPKGTVTFDKAVLSADGKSTSPAGFGQFAFELFTAVDDNGVLAPGDQIPNTDDPDGYYWTDMAGSVTVSDLVPGKYVFVEVPQAGWALSNYKDGLYFEIVDNGTSNSDTVWLTDGQKNDYGNPVVVNNNFGKLLISAGALLTTSKGEYTEYWQREATPYMYVSSTYGSVTATNADAMLIKGTAGSPLQFDPKNGNPISYDPKKAPNSLIVENSNHFTFAKLKVSDLAAGIPLTMVVGNNIDKCGTANVKEVNGQLQITIDNLYKGSFGAMAFGAVPEPKNGNIHSQKIADLVSSWKGAASIDPKDKNAAFSENLNSGTVTIPMPTTYDNGYIYLYIHGDFQFDQTNKADPNYDPSVGGIWAYTPYVYQYSVKGPVSFTYTSLDVNVTVKDADENIVDQFTLNSNKLSTVAKLLTLPAGTYTVEWAFDYPGDAAVYSATIDVTPGGFAVLPYIHKAYTEDTVWTEAANSPINLPDKLNPLKVVTK